MAGGPTRAVLTAPAFGTAYAVAVLVGRATRVDGSEVALLWPAAAVAVLWGLQARSLGRATALAHASLFVALSVAVNLGTGADLGLALWFAGVNLSLAVVTTAILTYDDRPVALREPADLARLVLATSAGALVAATLALAYFAHEHHDDLARTFTLFAVRNGVTALTVVAVTLRLNDARWRPPHLSRAWVLETVACAVVVGAVFARVFWSNPGLPTGFAIMLPAMWVSLRYSTTTSSIFLAVAASFIAWTTFLGRGPLQDLVPEDQALLAQGMVGSLTLVVLALALGRDSRDELFGQLRHLALHDPLTGLANRTLLTERLDDAIVHSVPGSIGVIVLDLDGFKLVNDAWGHGEGDLLLVEIARRLREVVRSGDTVARFGGDEFVVVCTRLRDAVELHDCAELIRERVADPYGQASDAPYDRITASVGIALSERSCTARSLLHRADQAMYEAKRAGRNLTRPLTDLAVPSER